MNHSSTPIELVFPTHAGPSHFNHPLERKEMNFEDPNLQFSALLGFQPFTLFLEEFHFLK